MRRAIAALTALSLTFGGAPAIAEDRAPTEEEIGKVVLGIAAAIAAGAIIKGINDRDSRDDHRDAARDTYDDHHDDYTPPGYRGTRDYERSHSYRADRHRTGIPAFRRYLPAACERVIEGRGYHRTLLGERCLAQHYSYTDLLPLHCRTYVFAGGRDRPAYAKSCLEDAGYRVTH